MTSRETEKRALALFEQMLALPSDERDGWLDEQVGDDNALRARVEAIRFADQAANLRTGAAIDHVGTAKAPERIGAYRIVGLIGHGGMGSVYRAERATGDFAHLAAIKIIKPGLLSESLNKRFLTERQLLADLRHPHIAQLLDGGELGDGSPYIIMEHIDGQSLPAWIAETAPDRDARCRLFAQVCDAVGFAHANLIVHRDLTPSNVLVTHGGSAKLIDFGIARPVAPEEDDGRTSASIGSLSLTPGYAAPERLERANVTTSADIFSLGKLLDRVLLPDETSPDFRAIVAKATAALPEDRYETVQQLADDVEAWRRGFPVAAVGGGRLYRLRRFARREKWLAASGAALFLALTVGLAATSWSYLRAEQARGEAEQRFDQVRALANFMLFDLYDTLEPVTGNTRALTTIADRASGYLDTLARESEADPALRLETANGLKRLSDVLGNPDVANLGRREEAGKTLRRAVGMLERLHEEQPGNVEVTRSLAHALYSLSVFTYIAEDDSEGTLPVARRSARLFGTLANRSDAILRDRVYALEARLQTLKPLIWLDQQLEGIAGMERLTNDAQALLDANPRDREVRKTHARILNQLAYAMSWTYDVTEQRGDYVRAIPIADRSINLYRRISADHPDDRVTQFGLLSAYLTRALIHYDLQNWQGAHLDLSAAETLGEAMLARDPDNSDLTRRLQTYRSQHAPILVELGRNDEAIAMARRVLAEREATFAREPTNPGYSRERASARALLAETLVMAGHDAEGCSSYSRALAEWQEIGRKSGGFDSLIQSNDVDPIAKAVADCRTRGIAIR